jgi:hypothetical protein
MSVKPEDITAVTEECRLLGFVAVWLHISEEGILYKISA